MHCDARRPSTSRSFAQKPPSTFAFLVSISWLALWLALTTSPGYCSPLEKKRLKRAQKYEHRTVISSCSINIDGEKGQRVRSAVIFAKERINWGRNDGGFEKPEDRCGETLEDFRYWWSVREMDYVGSRCLFWWSLDEIERTRRDLVFFCCCWNRSERSEACLRSQKRSAQWRP